MGVSRDALMGAQHEIQIAIEEFLYLQSLLWREVRIEIFD